MEIFESAVKSYETAKANGKKDFELDQYERAIINKRQTLEMAENACAREQASLRFARTIAVLLGFLGVVMLAISFIIGRKKREMPSHF